MLRPLLPLTNARQCIHACVSSGARARGIVSARREKSSRAAFGFIDCVASFLNAACVIRVMNDVIESRGCERANASAASLFLAPSLLFLTSIDGELATRESCAGSELKSARLYIKWRCK